MRWTNSSLARPSSSSALALPYQRWNLQPAIEPKFAQAGGTPGIESDLVGKPAPDFELETLDGPRFRLSDQRKKIVVLDFWATWCGPCMQTLPLLVPAVAKYRDRNVVLLAVNLQETPEAIKATLSRAAVENGRRAGLEWSRCREVRRGCHPADGDHRRRRQDRSPLRRWWTAICRTIERGAGVRPDARDSHAGDSDAGDWKGQDALGPSRVIDYICRQC